MCAQNIYAVANINTTPTTTTTKISAKTTNNCICCYQLRPCAVSSSSSSLSSSQTTSSATASSSSTSTNLSLHLLLVFTTALLIFDHCVSRTCAAPQSCVLCDVKDLQRAAQPNERSSNSYEEFLFEHQVSRQDAINALKLLNDSYYDGPSPELSCKSVSCTKTVMKYCLSSQFINDHCWCELGHTDEGLPFIPHICYVGEKSYSPSVGSCFFYEDVKNCCCAPVLAKQWRHISKANDSRNISCTWLTLLLLLSTVYWRHGYF